jgi:hypothetical protein
VKPILCEVHKSDAAAHALLVTSSVDVVELRAHIMGRMLVHDRPFRRVELRLVPAGVMVLFDGGSIPREELEEALR